MDMTEAGSFKYFLRNMNMKVGWLPRLWHSWTALAIDRAMGRAFALLIETPNKIRLRTLWLGYWPLRVDTRAGRRQARFVPHRRKDFGPPRPELSRPPRRGLRTALS